MGKKDKDVDWKSIMEEIERGSADEVQVVKDLPGKVHDQTRKLAKFLMELGLGAKYNEDEDDVTEMIDDDENSMTFKKKRKLKPKATTRTMGSSDIKDILFKPKATSRTKGHSNIRDILKTVLREK